MQTVDIRVTREQLRTMAVSLNVLALLGDQAVAALALEGVTLDLGNPVYGVGPLAQRVAGIVDGAPFPNVDGVRDLTGIKR